MNLEGWAKHIINHIKNNGWNDFELLNIVKSNLKAFVEDKDVVRINLVQTDRGTVVYAEVIELQK